MNLTWLADCFEKHYFFRRSVIYLQLYLVYDATHLSYAFMVSALQSDKGLVDVAGQVLALQGLVLALLGYTYKRYDQTRERERDVRIAPDSNEAVVVPDPGAVATGPR